MDARTRTNRDTWDVVSEKFINASALPTWGPFSVGENLKLIDKIKGKVFLEIACGSGRSIRYLTDRGAKKVYGVDFSQKQVEEARRYNVKAIMEGRVEILQETMEEKLKLEPVDVAFSIYGIGWTQNPKKTFANIYSYLKPGGKFIWSWDHTFFTNVTYKDGEFVVIYSYHDEEPKAIKNWRKEGFTAHITYRKTSTWHGLLTDSGFEVIGYYEPKPRDLKRAHDDPKEHYSIQKARLVPSSFIFECRKRNSAR